MPLRFTHLLASPRTWWVLFGLWAASIVVLSSLSALPSPPEQLNFAQIDKLFHAAAYCAGSALLCVALRLRYPWRNAVLAAVAFFAMAAFGLTDEIHQEFVPNRSGMDAGDLLADLLGTAVGIVIVLLLYAGIRLRNGRATDR